MDQKLYDVLNKSWKSTCRILLGEEIGELKEYEPWLRQYLPNISKRRSYLSDREVDTHIDYYCNKAKFVSLDEVKPTAIDPLSINDIKDIDSIVEAVSEKWGYCGNKVLGNSVDCNEVDVINDSQHVASSTNVRDSQYVFASWRIINSNYVFGSRNCGSSEFILNSLRCGTLKRSFECHLCGDGGDNYFSALCSRCNDMMFSFNQRYKSNCIGNLQLPKERYAELKKKLLKEIAEELKRSKRFYSLFELVPNVDPPADVKIELPAKKDEENMSLIEKSFASTFRITFKRDPGSIKQYEDWLSRYVIASKEVTSTFGSETYLLRNLDDFPGYSKLPIKRLISHKEHFQLDKLQLNEDDIANLDSVMNSIQKIGFISVEGKHGQYKNLIKTPNVLDSSNIYLTWAAVHSEYVGVSALVNKSAHVFGCNDVRASQFCINTYYSTGLNRCFELDSCMNCSDSLFSHNCEGLQEAMFCWNTKWKRYAIGNSELPPDRYRELKGALVAQMADEIEKKKSLEYNIYNIGCGKV